MTRNSATQYLAEHATIVLARFAPCLFARFDLAFNPGMDWQCQQGTPEVNAWPLFSSQGVTDLVFRGVSFEDVNRDGKPDLKVHARYVHIPSTTAVKKTKALCARDAKTVTPAEVLPRPKDLTLSWRSEGDEFIPMPATEKQIDQWTSPQPGP